MYIRTDINDIGARLNLSKNNQSIQKYMESLSTGKRINSAKDDAAGLAISERLTSQSLGSQQSSRNIQDGKSLLQVADGSSSIIQDLIKRAQEIAIQSANGTYNDVDRNSLEAEFNHIKQEIDRIAETTTFNNINLLNDSGIGNVDDQVIEDLKLQIPHWIDDSIKNIQSVLGLDSLPTGVNIDVQFYNDPASGTRGSMSGVPGTTDYVLKLNLGRLLDGSSQIPETTGSFPSVISGGDFDSVIAHEILHNVQFTKMDGLTYAPGETWFIEGLASAIQGRNTYFSWKPSRSDAVVSTSTWNGDYESSFAAIKALHEVTDGGIQVIVDRLEAGESLDDAIKNTTQLAQGEFSAATTGTGVNELHSFQSAKDFIDWFNSSSDVDYYLNNSTDFTSGEGAVLPGEGTSNSADRAGTIPNNTTLETGPNNAGVYNVTFADAEKGTVKLHVGYRNDDIVEIEKGNLTNDALNIKDLSIATREDAENAISVLLNSLNSVSSYRGKIGAYINRIEVMESNLSTFHLQTERTNSVIKDADMSSVMSSYVKADILSQTAMNMIKMNQTKRSGILQLLQG